MHTPVVNSTGVASNTPTVSHNDHQMAVARLKGVFDKRVGGDGKFIPEIDKSKPFDHSKPIGTKDNPGDRSKHAFAALLELPAAKFKALTANQEKTILAASALETPDVIEALVYHLAQDKNAFEKNPIIHSLSTQLQAEATKLTTTPPVAPIGKQAIEAHDKLLISVKGQIGNLVATLKK
jgi:hypothetical protein